MELAPEQSPDWGYARNQRLVLMAPSAEWVQSAFSSTWEDGSGDRFIAPNRDYPYEGLLAYHGGEHWKFVDCIALGMRDGNGAPLVVASDPARKVQITPWRATYSYIASYHGAGYGSSVPFAASYYLSSNSSPELATAGLYVYFPGSAVDHGLTLIIQPLLDIRHMYSGSDHDAYQVHADEQNRLHITYMNRRITFHLPPCNLDVFNAPQRLPWSYKLGTGARREAAGEHGRMETWFIPEDREVASLFRLEISLTSRRRLTVLPFSCGLDGSNPHASSSEAAADLRRSRRSDSREERQMVATFPLRQELEVPLREALVGRIVGLRKFKNFMYVPETREHVQIPPAGAWWFRTAWYRDVFEGLSSSFETLMRLPEDREKVKQIVLHALRYQHPQSGLIQARLPEFASMEPSYNSSDATLLCLLVATRYAERTADLDFAREVLPCALRSIVSFRANYQTGRLANGPPRLDPETGLLLSVPHHSWIDTQSQCVEYAGWTLEALPNRVSERFVKDLYDVLGDKNSVELSLHTSSFFLPEVNAQWLKVLSGVLDMARHLAGEPDEAARSVSTAEVGSLLERARQHFNPVFWNEEKEFLYNVVEEKRQLRDEIECEAAVTAAAMLERTVFSDDELNAIWRRTETCLLVKRRLQRYGTATAPFGILVKYDDKRIFYDDDQYHSDVVWPRSTVYLVRLLDLLGQQEAAREVLRNMLDHQMTEAAIFYNQEVLSRPCGNNPAPVEHTHGNPVPVKNPIQFWSQWCDEFLKAYEEKASQDATGDNDLRGDGQI